MNNEKQEFKQSNVITVATAHLLHDTFSSFFAPLIPLLTEKLGFTYAMAGMLSVVQKIPSLLNPLIGIIADKLVIRSGIIITPIITIITMGLLGLAPSVAMLAVLLFFCGISAAVLHVTAPVLMRQVSGAQIGRGMSYFMFGGEIARTFGPLLIISAVSWWGLEGTWKLIPFGLVASLFLFFNLRTIDKRHIRSFQGSKKSSMRKTLRKIGPFFALVAPILLFRGFSKTALTLFLPTYMVANGSSIKMGAAALALMELTGAIGALTAGSLSDRIGRKTVLLVIIILTPVLMFIFTLTSGFLQWGLLGLIGLVFFASTPVFMAMIHDLNSDRPAFANGIFMTISFAASSTVALLIGILADNYGFVKTYQIAAALSLCAIPLVFVIKDNRHENP